MTTPLRIVCIIQSRMSSQRLPGKALREVLGQPLLGYLIERMRRCTAIDDIILATSIEPSDDQLASFAESIYVACYRGPLNDVASRMLGAAESFKADALVRISGDSPMMDSDLVDRLVTIFRANPELDLVTNVQQRTFPKGQSVEILSTATLRRLIYKGLSPYEQEHVTTALYRQPDSFNIVNVTNDQSQGEIQLSVDTEYDLDRFQVLLEALGKPYWQHSIESVTSVASRLP